MTSDEQDKIEHSLTLIMEDAENDARKDIPFTAFGIGTRLGEVCAQIHALAAICRQLLDAAAIDNDPDGSVEAAIYECVMSYDAYGSS